jgi:hypothetical protein
MTWRHTLVQPTHPIWTVARILALAALIPGLSYLTATSYDLDGEGMRDLLVLGAVAGNEIMRRRS